MKLIISEAVREKFPDLNLVLLPVNAITVATGKEIINEPELAVEIKKSKEPDFFNQPAFATFREIYKKIGLNPAQEPPAAENLYRNYLRKGRFSKINNVVDSANLVSIKTYTHLGVFDADHIEGDLVLRYSHLGEEYRPLGGRIEILPDGVLVTADSKKIFNKFPYRDSIYAAVTPKTKNIIVLGDIVKGFQREIVEQAVRQTADLIVQNAGGSIGKLFLSEDESKTAVIAYSKEKKKQSKERVFSGIRATGRLHLGNYLGAVKGMLDLQNSGKYETVYCVVDVHTITTPYQVELLRRNKREIIIDYLVAGLDPKKSMIIYQSDVPEHTELAFYFSSVVTIARMQHLPTFKEKVKQYPKNSTMALLNYPILMAADILVYKAGLVPVGIDQEPHLEVAREIARKMNQEYGMDFPEPVRFATKGEYIPSLHGEGKMSKSVEGSYINLTDSLDAIRKKVRSVPTATTSGGEMSAGVKSLFTFAELFLTESVDDFRNRFDNGTLKFVELKDTIAEAIYNELRQFQEKRAQIVKEQDYVDRVIRESAEKARAIAFQTVREVKQKMGLLL